jgi:glycosyltransferase involved in cell wall biosynthesis
MLSEYVLVSVLIPNFNYGRFISETVRSVEKQDYENIELIIVDDGSKDDSISVIEEITKETKSRFKRVRTIYSKENKGVNNAINEGMKLVEGKVTIILDSDDTLLPEYVSRQTSLLLENEPESVGFVYSNTWLMDKDGKVLDQGLSNEFDPELLQTESYLPGCGATLTRVLREVLPLDVKIKTATKVKRWRGIVSNGYRGLHIPEPLFHYRMHDDNISGIGLKILDEHQNGRINNPMLKGYWAPH